MPDLNEVHDHSNLPPELYMALGRLSARYGLFEYELALTIKRFSLESRDWDETWNWLGDFMRGKLEKEAIKVFELRKANQQQRHELDKIIETAKELAKKRNDAVHCAWAIKNGRVGATRKGAPLNMTIDDVNELAERFHELASRLAELESKDFVKEELRGITVYSSSAAFRVP